MIQDQQDTEGSKSATIDVMDKLEAQGFCQTFKLENGVLRCSEKDKPMEYRPKDVKICGTFRFEGASDPDDSRVVYALEASDGNKGIVIDAFGIYASPELAQFLDGVYDAREQCKLVV